MEDERKLKNGKKDDRDLPKSLETIQRARTVDCCQTCPFVLVKGWPGDEGEL